MQIWVGCSGWSNPIWNPNGLLWYKDHAHLDAIELSMPFYQLPTEEQVEEWAKEGQGLVWCVKMNRAVTHFFRFNDIAFDKFSDFLELFKPLDSQVQFYLFQLPPNAHPAMRDDIEKFYSKSGLKHRFALEWRNQRWFNKEYTEWARKLGITIVSADSAYVPRDIICTGDTVYLRLHGRSDWFIHHYSRKELGRIADQVVKTGCSRVFAFLNNESSQLKNARALKAILEEKLGAKKLIEAG
jgi:uncharacterized protein YecE (DUF72 family)